MKKNSVFYVDGFIRLSLLKVAEVARLLNISESHAYRLIHSGDLPSVRMGRSLRVKPADLEEYISNKTQGGTQPTVGLEDQDD